MIRWISKIVFVTLLYSCFALKAQNNRITLGCKQYFLSGSNVAWSNSDNGHGNGIEDHFGWDFATRPWGGGTSGYSASWWDAHFAQLQSQGANCVRVWVHADGRADPEYDGSGNITGSDPFFNAAMDDMLNKAKNHNILVILCLWDAVVLNSGPHGKSVLTSQTTNYINNVLVPMATRYKNQCNLLAYDIINEPEAMYENSQATKAELQIFSAKCAEAIHGVDPTIKVTVGSKCLRYNSGFSTTNSMGNWWSDASLQAAYPAGNTSRTKLDFYSPHFYYWMNDPGNGWDFAPFKRDALLGGALGYGSDKPMIVGETAYNPTSPGVVNWTRQQMLDQAYTKNFAGVLYWASSAASGHGDNMSNWSADLLTFRNAHIPEVDFSCGSGSCCTQPNMGTNKTTCGGGISFPYLLNSNAGSTTNKTYTWKLNNSVIGGATAASYNATSAGTYVVIIDSGLVQHCITTDTIILSNTLASPSLGANFNLCTPAFKDLDGNDYGATAVTYTWQKNGTTLNGQTGRFLMNVRTSGTYTVVVSSVGCADVSASVTATSSAGLPVPTDGCRTGAGIVNLSVTGPGTYKWYGNATGTGSYITTGLTYNPTLPANTTTTYWVEDASSVAGQVGPTSQIGGGYGRNAQADDYRFRLNFNTGPQAVTINSVKVWAWINTAGTTYYVNVRILDQSGVVMNTVDVPISSASTGWNAKVLPLGITVPANVTGWKMDGKGTTSTPYCDLYYAPSGASYGYNSTPSGMLTITGQDATWEPNGYPYFYDWQISTGTVCGRVPIVATTEGCSIPAPVSLLNFSAVMKGKQTTLSWSTASEINNAYFDVERSDDQLNFKTIGRINGSGNSNILLYYSFEDLSPLKGISYYRLRQTDLNGNYYYSSIVAGEHESNAALQVYPHPITKEEASAIVFTVLESQEVQLRLTDLMGNTVFASGYAGKEGVNTVAFPNPVASGIYFLNFSTKNESIIKKIIVQ